MSDPAKAIRIGTMLRGTERGGTAPLDVAKRAGELATLGFESFQPFFWQTTRGHDLAELGKRTLDAVSGHDITISTLGIFGNPLQDKPLDIETVEGWKDCITNAKHFGATCIAGFTGRIAGQPIEDSLPRFHEVFGELAKLAADHGVNLAFENCSTWGNWASGDWNIAHTPDAWELMFNAVPDDNLGLEWEPCHQLVYLIDPLPQIAKWAPKIFHVHGKDATVRWDVIREHGIFGKVPFVHHRTPGFGDSNWVDIIGELRRAGYEGAIDIEGWHDPVYCDELEMMGQVYALNHLKQCRGGDYVDV